MKEIKRNRIVNRYNILSSLFITVFAFVSWLISSEIIAIFFSYGDDVKNAMTYWQYIGFMLDQLLCWEFFVDGSMRYICLVFPIFSSVALMQYADELKSYYLFGCNRFENYKKNLLKGLIECSVIGGAIVSVPLIIYITLADYFMYPSIDNIGGLTGIFPPGFYGQHPYFVYLFMIAVLYFLLGVSYAAMAGGVFLIFESKILLIIVPLFLYIFENYLSGFFTHILLLSTMDIVTSYNTLLTVGQLLVPLLFHFFIAVLVVIIGLNKQKRKDIMG